MAMIPLILAVKTTLQCNAAAAAGGGGGAAGGGSGDKRYNTDHHYNG